MALLRSCPFDQILSDGSKSIRVLILRVHGMSFQIRGSTWHFLFYHLIGTIISTTCLYYGLFAPFYWMTSRSFWRHRLFSDAVPASETQPRDVITRWAGQN